MHFVLLYDLLCTYILSVIATLKPLCKCTLVMLARLLPSLCITTQDFLWMRFQLQTCQLMCCITLHVRMHSHSALELICSGSNFNLWNWYALVMHFSKPLFFSPKHLVIRSFVDKRSSLPCENPLQYFSSLVDKMSSLLHEPPLQYFLLFSK